MRARMIDPLLTAKEAGILLRVHPKTVYRWARQGRLPASYVNGRPRFRQSELDGFIEKGRAKSLLEDFPKVELSLDAYDKMHLKGGCGAVSKKRRRWNYGFGSVYLRKTRQGADRWCIDFYDQERRVRRVVKDAQGRGEAVIALQAKVAEVFNGKFKPKRRAESLRFADFAERYLNDYAKTSKRSWKTDASYLKPMKEFFGDVFLSSIAALDIEKFKTRRLEDGVTRSTVNRCLAILRRMLNLAIDWGYLEESPMRKVGLFPVKDNLKERILDREEEPRLLESCSEHLRAIVITALSTGMRRGEILGLKWDDADFQNRVLKVEKSKSGKQRFIEMNSPLFSLMRELRVKNPQAGHVFLNPKTGRPLADVKTAFKAACRRAGIKGLRFHDLRHTFATRLVEAGVDIVTVRDLLGHSSVRLTERYTHSRNELKRRAVEALAAEKPGVLAHIWHAQGRDGSRPSLTRFYSMN